MASTFITMSSVGFYATPSIGVPDNKCGSSLNKLSSFGSVSSSTFGRSQNVFLRRARSPRIYAAKNLYFNKDGSAIKRLQVSLSISLVV